MYPSTFMHITYLVMTRYQKMSTYVYAYANIYQHWGPLLF